MRVWHPKLLPYLCRNHILGSWREGLGCYSIITQGKKGYSHHPQVLEYAKCPSKLWMVLKKTRAEMIKRGYNPKPLPELVTTGYDRHEYWQSLSEQIKHLKSKNCNCDL